VNPGKAVGRTLCRTLEAHGSNVVFGVPGTQTVPLFEALRSGGVRTVLTTSELGAGFAALGWARMARRAGIVSAIPGPGLLVGLAAVAEARHDSVPLVLLTGIPAAGHRFPLQALDQAALAAPVVKAALRAERASDVPGVVARALRLAEAGEPGPVLVELPLEELDDPAPGSTPTPIGHAAPDPGDVAAVAARLAAARRPLILAGLGCAGAPELLLALAERILAPVATTVSGRGIIPEDHPLALAMDPGTEALAALNDVLDQADLILALGCKFTHNGTGGFRLRLPAARLVHVDASPASLGGDYPASLAVAADVPALLSALLATPAGDGAGGWDPATLEAARSDAHRRVSEGLDARASASGLDLPALFAALRAALPRSACLVTDSGMHQMLVRRHVPILGPDGLLVPADFQSMGFGVPTALGAAIARPDRTVVAVVGDGGFAMTGLELLAAVREAVPLKVLVLSDGRLGLIHRQQVESYGRAHAVELGPFEPGAVALATGTSYRRLRGDPRAGLDEWLAIPGPAVLEVPLRPTAPGRLAELAGAAKSAARGALSPRLLAALRRLRD
jgi:acetolactate synthase-1/2/3 large subunit